MIQSPAELKGIKKLVKKGHAHAQAHLAEFYYEGTGLKKSIKKSDELNLLSSMQGHPGATYMVYCNLNHAHLITGEQQATEEQIILLKKTAKLKHMHAQMNLGTAYEIGTPFTKQSYRKAIKWYRRAIEQGQAEAAYKLGLLYANGSGEFEVDIEKAKSLLQYSVDQSKLLHVCYNDLPRMYDPNGGFNTEYPLQRLSLLSKNSKRLRFTLGQRVECSTPTGFQVGVITQINPAVQKNWELQFMSKKQRKKAYAKADKPKGIDLSTSDETGNLHRFAYHILLENKSMSVSAPLDTDNFIRKLSPLNKDYKKACWLCDNVAKKKKKLLACSSCQLRRYCNAVCRCSCLFLLFFFY